MQAASHLEALNRLRDLYAGSVAALENFCQHLAAQPTRGELNDFEIPPPVGLLFAALKQYSEEHWVPQHLILLGSTLAPDTVPATATDMATDSTGIIPSVSVWLRQFLEQVGSWVYIPWGHYSVRAVQ